MSSLPTHNPPLKEPVGAEDPHRRYFSTDHLMGDLKGRSLRGGTVTLTAQTLKFVLHMGSTVVLARLLLPSDFGLIAMVIAVTGFVEMFKDAGLSTATVQRKDITHAQVSTLFWINVALGFVATAVIAALSPLIAAFYSQPALVPITLVLATAMIFGGLTTQHQALLRRQMRFKALAIIQVSAMTSGIIVAIVMAVLGFGYWALVGNICAAAATNAVLVWVFCDWRPGLPRRGSGAMSMLKFGGNVTGFSFLNYFTRNADNVIIGFVMGSGPLGIYSKAYNLLMLPIRQINAPVGAVMVPSLSRLQDEPARYKRAYLQAMSALAMVGMPVVVVAYVLAHEMVLLLLGDEWKEAATVFRWLAPAALFGTVNVAPGWLCVSLGKPQVQVRWALMWAPITVSAFAIGVHWGVDGVAAAFSLSWCIGNFVFIAMACHGSPVRKRDLAARLAPQLTASLLSAAIGLLVLWAIAGPVPSAIARIAIVGPLVGLAYLGVLWLIPGSRAQLTTLLRDGVKAAATKGGAS
ncbi:MAG: lipopolysaccharide biosynthesis protein [Phycisphaerales bacterium]|jgi:O-antigen/teichoic acid export membrane protein